MTETTTIRREVEVDTALAALYAELYKARATRKSRADAVHFALGERREHVSRNVSRWPTTDATAVAELVSRVDSRSLPAWSEAEAERTLAHLSSIDEKIDRLNGRIEELDAEWAERRWSRFFLVTGGHIHASMSCSTCRPTTEFGWLPELSGLSEADAVAAHGPLLCSVCFPSAPVEWTVGETKADTSCTGTRDYDAPSRTGFYSGNWATCTCGARVTVTSTGKLRKHATES